MNQEAGRRHAAAQSTDGDPQFLGAALNWSADKFENWFRTGFSAVADDPNGNGWELAFDELSLTFQKDPVDQIVAQLNALGKRSQEAYRCASKGLEHLIQHLGNGCNAVFLQLLLQTASSVRPAGAIEIGKLRLSRPEVREAPREWQRVADILVQAAASYNLEESFSDLIDSLKAGPFWRPLYARDYIVASVRRRPANWLELLDRFRPDLDELRDKDAIAFNRLGKELAKYVPVRRIASALPNLITSEFEIFDAVARAMFDKREGLTIQTVLGDKFRLTHGRVSVPVPIVLEQNVPKHHRVKWITFIEDFKDDLLSPEESYNEVFDEAENVVRLMSKGPA